MIRRELSLRLANSPGALADVCASLDNERVRVQAMMLDAAGMLRLVVDNPVRATGVLRDRRHVVTERDVIVTTVSSAPGGAASALALLRDGGVNIDYVWTAAAESAATTLVVIGVDDAVRASMTAGL